MGHRSSTIGCKALSSNDGAGGRCWASSRITRCAAHHHMVSPLPSRCPLQVGIDGWIRRFHPRRTRPINRGTQFRQGRRDRDVWLGIEASILQNEISALVAFRLLFSRFSPPSPFRCWSLWEARASHQRGVDSVVTLFKKGFIAEGQDLRGFGEEACGWYSPMFDASSTLYGVCRTSLPMSPQKCFLRKMGCWVLFPSCYLIFFCLCGRRRVRSFF